MKFNFPRIVLSNLYLEGEDGKPFIALERGAVVERMTQDHLLPTSVNPANLSPRDAPIWVVVRTKANRQLLIPTNVLSPSSFGRSGAWIVRTSGSATVTLRHITEYNVEPDIQISFEELSRHCPMMLTDRAVLIREYNGDFSPLL